MKIQELMAITEWTDYDLQGIFGLLDYAASKPLCSYVGVPIIEMPVPSMDEVKQVHQFAVKGESYGEPSFAMVMELHGGMWAAVTAWHDYTGWDCQSGAYWKIAPTYEDAIERGLDNEGRTLLGLELTKKEIS